MNIDTRKILAQTGNKIVSEIKSEFDKKGLNATNKAKNSLSSTATAKQLKIKGMLRIMVLNSGRLPGKFPPLEPIREWVRIKLNVPDSQVNSVAFLIARKIARSGTAILTDRTKGLELELLLDKIMHQVHEDFSKQLNVSIGTEIANFMQQ